MADLISLLQDWLPAQRWFVGRGPGPVRLQLLGSYSLADPGRDPGVRFITVAILAHLTGGEQTVRGVYQVPLVIRAVDGAIEADGYIGTYLSETGRAAVVDGPHDPAYVRAVLDLIRREQTAAGPGGRDDAVVYGLSMPGADAGRVHASRVLQGEQSNTSIVVETRDRFGAAEAAPLIVKVFRALHDGPNPDVTLQSALAAAGSRRVPPAVGQVGGQWPDPRAVGGRAGGHLLFVQEFFAGVEDAWRVAVRAAEAGEDFTEAARTLGEATAETHEVLRAVMPTARADDRLVQRAGREMRLRLERAIALVPQLAGLRDEVLEVYAAASRTGWPPLQRIHGDYHLGQVLAVPERGWVLLDFEGEPLRPLAERNAPDLAVRDLAGMLRSFDYVAGALAQTAGGRLARSWADAAREAFLLGYAQRAQDADRQLPEPLLRAYELDKAVYETIYEASHRPQWLPIPLAAIRRLLAAAPPGSPVQMC